MIILDIIDEFKNPSVLTLFGKLSEWLYCEIYDQETMV